MLIYSVWIKSLKWDGFGLVFIGLRYYIKWLHRMDIKKQPDKIRLYKDYVK